jgi:hypothetical protein
MIIMTTQTGIKEVSTMTLTATAKVMAMNTEPQAETQELPKGQMTRDKIIRAMKMETTMITANRVMVDTTTMMEPTAP